MPNFRALPSKTNSSTPNGTQIGFVKKFPTKKTEYFRHLFQNFRCLQYPHDQLGSFVDLRKPSKLKGGFIYVETI